MKLQLPDVRAAGFFGERIANGRGGFVAENILDLFGTIGVALEQDVNGSAELFEPGVGVEERLAAIATLDTVEVGRQGEAAPPHFEEILLKCLSCVAHAFILSVKRAGSSRRQCLSRPKILPGI
jgi:hypothetical protein